MPASPLLKNALTLWQGLQPRERVLIAGAGALLSLTIVYAVLWVPMQRDLRQLRAAIPQAETHLAQMRRQLVQVQQLKAAHPTGGAQVSLQTAVEQTAAAAGINTTITRLEARGPKTVEVSLDGVAFDKLARWIADLQKKHPVLVDTATIDRQSAPGVVNARLTLRTVVA